MRKSVLVPAGKSLESPSQRRLLPFRASKRSSKNPRKRRKPQRREGKSKRKKRRTRRQPQRRKPLQRQLRLKNPKKTLSARPRKQFHTKIAIDRPNHCVLAEKRGFVPPQTTRHKKNHWKFLVRWRTKLFISVYHIFPIQTHGVPSRFHHHWDLFPSKPPARPTSPTTPKQQRGSLLRASKHTLLVWMWPWRRGRGLKVANIFFPCADIRADHI